MSATQILFNSPALHSLKRDQLVKLCKLHSVKANGKNVELIERLKQRALELSPEALAEDAADLSAVGIVAPIASQDETPSIQDEDETMEDAQTIPGGFGEEPAPYHQSAANEDYEMQDVVLTSRFSIPRPSEQWEIVMEDIQEVDEGRAGTMSSKGSLRTLSNGEFGTHTSKGMCMTGYLFILFQLFIAGSIVGLLSYDYPSVYYPYFVYVRTHIIIIFACNVPFIEAYTKLSEHWLTPPPLGLDSLGLFLHQGPRHFSRH